jgi:hypothetical protein
MLSKIKITIAFLVVAFFSINGSNNSLQAASGPGTGWIHEEIWCIGPFGGLEKVDQCDEAGGWCTDQVCGCGYTH